MQLEVGKSYLNRKGEVENIVHRINDFYPFLSDRSHSFTKSGEFISDEESDFDLISEYTGPAPKRKPSHTQQVLEYLEAGNTLTHMDALRLFDCARLAARINDLRKKGHIINTKMKLVRSGKEVAEYSLVKK